jgi:hypothetical protein
MKVSIFGSCRQDSISKYFTVSSIKEKLTFPHYTKEIIQAIQYCKGNFKHDPSMTQYCFRTGILEKKPITCQQELQNEFQSSDVIVVEIASRKSYEWNDIYVHHILTESQYGFHDIENITIRDLSDEEIEADLLEIQDLVFPKKLVVISHIYTRQTGKRYELVKLLEHLTDKYQIPFINPSVELASYKIEDIYVNEPIISHYTQTGHSYIGDIYKKYLPVHDIDYLTVYKPEAAKIRIGSIGDGGYIASSISGYDALISCGISDNIDFEEDFLTRNSGIPCFAYDGTIQDLPHKNEAIRFYKKNIGVENTETTTNLHEVLSQYKNIFLKMDIETFEFRWLHTLSLDHLKRIKQLVIEFHFPTSIHPYKHLDIQIPVVEKMEVFQKLASTHWLVHFHGNNCCDSIVYKNVLIPNVFECTYIRKDQQSFCGYNTDTIPSVLDVPNVQNKSDITLLNPPFCMR